MVAATATAPVPITTPAPGADAWVESLEPGTHQGDVYTPDDLSDMLLNFRLAKRFIDPPIKLGHEDDQPLLKGVPGLNTGRPAVGWVDDVKIEERADHTGKVRPVLLTKPGDVHPHIAGHVRNRSYRKLSPEVYYLPAGVLDRAGVLAELRRRGKDADSAMGEALTWATKERTRQQADRERQLAAGVSEDVARRVASEEELADAYLRRKLGKVLRGLALLGEDLPVIKTLADLPFKAFGEGGVRAHRHWLAHHAAWCYSEGGGSMDRAQIEAHLKAAGISEAAIAHLAGTADEDLQAFGMEILAKLAGTADAAAGEGAGAATDAAAPVPDVTADTGATPDAETMIADLVALGEDEAALRAMDEASLAALWKEKKGTAMSETATRRPVTAADLAAFERRLKLAQQQQAALIAIQGRRYARERAAEDARLCERWRDDWHDLPREFDENPAAPNFRQNLAAADDTTKRNYGGKLMTQREAMIASMEARGKNYARRNFSEKVKDQHQGSDFADVDASVDAYVKRRHGRRKTA